MAVTRLVSMRTRTEQATRGKNENHGFHGEPENRRKGGEGWATYVRGKLENKGKKEKGDRGKKRKRKKWKKREKGK